MDAFLNNVLRWLITFHNGIYILLGLGILIYLRKFLIGLREWKRSVFGLERDRAQRKLVSASTGLTLLILLVIGEFLLVTVIGPRLPGQTFQENIARPSEPSATEMVVVDDDQIEEINDPLTAAGEPLDSVCIEDVLEITSPNDGEAISGTVEIIGSVNIENFGSYKYEYSTTAAEDWITIAAGNRLKLNESLGSWYTSDLPPGTYLLKLVPLNNNGDELKPCIVRVEVVREE